ncbi:hypothetical protein GCM10027047_05980 [Rhodococcus aerolatus]
MSGASFGRYASAASPVDRMAKESPARGKPARGVLDTSAAPSPAGPSRKAAPESCAEFATAAAARDSAKVGSAAMACGGYATAPISTRPAAAATRVLVTFLPFLLWWATRWLRAGQDAAGADRRGGTVGRKNGPGNDRE